MQRKEPSVVVITGASCGLGKALALTFASHGLHVIVNYHASREAAHKVVALIREKGGTALAIRADVRDRNELSRMYERAIDEWGHLDILINNAGVIADRRIRNLSENEWEGVISVNLTGTLYAIQSILPHMLKQGYGHILNIASYVGIHGRIGQANYAASKAGVIALTKTVARELGHQNIRANTVLPSLLNIGMGARLSPTQQARIQEESVLPTPPPLDQVTEFIHTLACMEGVSGQIFNLDSRILY
jgi:3-oxoacyl-[acyl-carrier protein] reductase